MAATSSDQLVNKSMLNVSKDSVSKRQVIIASIGMIGIFVIGLVIGRFAIPRGDGAFLNGVSQAIVQDGDPTVHAQLVSRVSAQNIEENLRQLTAKPHLAGTPADYDQAKELADLWTQQGFDDVTITPYDVMLSYPDPANPNYVRLLGENNSILYQSPEKEAILTERENVSGVVPPFNAYSAPGVVRGDLVYVNYGRDDDFKYVTNVANVSVTGRIAIVKYGMIFRGDKAKAAEKYGAIGLIIYSDPQDYAKGDNPDDVYPNSKWLPPTGAQRGSLYVTDGDPETPGYPSIDTAYRVPESEITSLPNIPVHPISYGEAEQLMKYMAGDLVPTDWRGTMNIEYRFGPGFRNDTVRQAEMDISTSNQKRTIYNTIGVIKGSIEPDRYVVLGNHRDAWVFGAMDPSSGTAVMMEVARVVAEMVRLGQWQPRRTLIFCSWAAEEYGLIGSNEWVEEYVKSLGERTVAYINVDTSVSGDYSLKAGSTPLLYRVVYEAAKTIPDHRGGISMYDRWLAARPWTQGGLPENVPLIDRPGSGSDHAPFLQKAGIPSIDLNYGGEERSFPLYHSVYETFYAMKNFFDPEFKVHASMTSLWVEMARNLADSLLLPYNVSDYGVILEQSRRDLDDSLGQTLAPRIQNYSALETEIQEFQKVADAFMTNISMINKNDPLAVRKANDQMMQLERAFIDPAGLPGRSYFKHVFLAPSKFNIYEGASFPGLVDLVSELETTDDEKGQWELIKHHFSVLLFIIQSAASTLRDVSYFVES